MDLMGDLVMERFGAAALRELCREPGIFEPGKLYRRVEISQRLRDAFVACGGSDDTTKHDVAIVLKKWLTRPESPFRREARGRYRFLGPEGEAERLRAAHDQGNSGGRVSHGDPAPEREIGEGRHEVYAWCLPQYQVTAGRRWPIKIGRAGPEGFARRWRDFRENLPERPRYVLRLACADEREARDREALLHAWFRTRGRKLKDLPGQEWFLTNPAEIDEAIRNIIGPADLVGDRSAVRIEDLMAEAFKDVKEDEWTQLPGDLTDRLDDHLYGDVGT